jgi:hypothetical protein
MRWIGPLGWLGLGILAAIALYAAGVVGFLSGHLGIDPAFNLGVDGFLLAAVSWASFLWAMVLDCLRRSWPDGATRLTYLSLILLVVPAGAILYYLTVARRGGAA